MQEIVIAGLYIPLPLLIAAVGFAGACIPLIFNKVFLSRKDRNDDNQKLFENSKSLLSDSVLKANQFQAAIGKAVKAVEPSVDDVLVIMERGEVYFATLKVMAQAVLDERVSSSTRTHDFVPKIGEALEKSVPTYYDTLQTLCSKIGLPFTGEFKEESYESLFRVVDLYDHEAWKRAKQMVAGVRP